MRQILKKGYILTEALVSMLIISAVSIAALYIVGSYFKSTYVRDTQIKQVIENVSIIEQLKSEVHTLSDLYDFSERNDIRIIAVGAGEISLTKKSNGDITVIKTSNEAFGFSEILKPDNLYRIEISGTLPSTKLTAILRLEGS